MSFPDPYLEASFIDKLKEGRTIFLTDLDGTHATRLSSFKELEDRARVRALADKKGFVSGAVTARTPALTMSSSVYEDSRKNGFTEAPPRWSIDAENRRVYAPLEELPFFAHSLDWDVVAGMGSGVFPRNGSGYLLDREYDNLLKYDYARGQNLPAGIEPVAWREAALLFLVDWPWINEHFSPIEYSRNYLEGKTDVMPLPYRIQLDFAGAEGLERMRAIKAAIETSVNNPIARRMAIVDESKPGPDPNASKYTIYLMPWAARKEKMINHLIARSAAAARVPPSSLRLYYAGDTPTDLRAGLWAGGSAPLTFLLATGSPLAPYLIEGRPQYGDESLSFLAGRFYKSPEKGVYTFRAPGRRWKNTIVIGDERYPALTAPGSVAAFLEEFA